MSGGLWDDDGIDLVQTLRKVELDRETIGACRRLQEQVLNPNPNWDGTVDSEQFAPKCADELTSGAALEAEIDLVQAQGPASGERWHLVREGGTVIAKAQTHTRQLCVLPATHTKYSTQKNVAARHFTVLALTGVTVSPSVRGRGLGQLVIQAAFAQLALLQEEAAPEAVEAAQPPACCLFQTGSAMPFYQKLGARVIDRTSIVQGADGGQLAFTDKFVMIWPSSCPWPPPVSAADNQGPSSIRPPEHSPTEDAPLLVDACGYTGSWARWREAAPGTAPSAAHTSPAKL